MTRRLRSRALWFTAPLALAAPPQGGPAFTLEDAPWELAITSGGVPGTFGRAAAGQLDDDGVLDAAVLVDQGVRVSHDPAMWSVRSVLGGGEIHDLALFPHGSAETDALATVGADGLRIWRWNSVTHAFVAEPIAGPWTQPLGVRIAPIPAAGARAVVLVLDGASTLYFVLLGEGVAPGGQASRVDLSSSVLAAPTQPSAVALLDWRGIGVPDVAVANANGLSVFAIGDTPLHAQAAVGTSDLLTPLAPAPGIARERLAWVSQEPSHATPRLRVLDQGGSENPVLLAWSVSALDTGRLNPASTACEDLILGRAQRYASSWVLKAGCESGSPTTYSALPSCRRLAEGPAPGQVPVGMLRTQALFADFDADGWDDVVSYDDASGNSLVLGRIPVVPMPPPPVTVQATALVGPPTFYQLSIPSQPLQMRGAERVRVRVFPWQDYLTAELDPTPLLDTVRDVPSGSSPVEILLDEPDSATDALAIEVCAIDDSSDPSTIVTTDTFAFTQWCDVQTYFDSMDFPVVDESGCLSGPPAMGDYLGGVRLPRFPPFGEGPDAYPNVINDWD